jgi:hypothetical protein
MKRNGSSQPRHGKVLASADTDNRVDEIAYDPHVHSAYCPGGSGKVAVIGV